MVGTQTNGQGHDTAYAQVLHQRLGRAVREDPIVQGDTDRIKAGGGTGGSRSLTAQGMAINDAADIVIERGKAFAAQRVRDRGGRHPVRGRHLPRRRHRPGDRHHGAGRQGAGDGAGHAAWRAGSTPTATTTLSAWTFPNGCHIAEVEVDPDTGTVEVVDYNVVDDFGVVLNPMLVEGQVHGGIVQGIGQALLEGAVYDDSGQLLTGSFMDYAMPRADNMPSFDFSTFEVPCKNNAMGVKGCGEAGLGRRAGGGDQRPGRRSRDVGVRHVDMPATAEKVWRLAATALGSLSVRDLGRRWTAQIEPSFRRHGGTFAERRAV